MVLITHNLLLTRIVTTCRLLIVFEIIFNPCHVRLNVGSFLNSKLRDQLIFMKYIIVEKQNNSRRQKCITKLLRMQ